MHRERVMLIPVDRRGFELRVFLPGFQIGWLVVVRMSGNGVGRAGLGCAGLGASNLVPSC
jgi:hypothetical protein